MEYFRKFYFNFLLKTVLDFIGNWFINPNPIHSIFCDCKSQLSSITHRRVNHKSISIEVISKEIRVENLMLEREYRFSQAGYSAQSGEYYSTDFPDSESVKFHTAELITVNHNARTTKPNDREELNVMTHHYWPVRFTGINNLIWRFETRNLGSSINSFHPSKSSQLSSF